MESQCWRRALRIDTTGEVTREQHGADARDVGLEAERKQIEHDLDVLVERLRYAHGHCEILWCRGRRTRGDLQATLDFAHVLSKGIQPCTVRRTDLVAHTLDLVVD